MFQRLPSYRLASRTLLAVALVFPLAGMGAKIELPDWEDDDKPEKFVLGGGLWPEGVMDVAATAPKDGKEGDKKAGDEKSAGKEGDKKPTDPANPEADGDVKLANTDTEGVSDNPPGEEPTATKRRVREIPPGMGPEVPETISIAEATLPPLVDEAEDMPPIEGQLRDQFFKYRPRAFLIDPQQMLTEQKSNDVRRFLEYHAEEAGIDIYLMVMGKGQQIPADISLDAQHREWFGEMPTALVATTMGSMGHTQFAYGDQITGSVEKSALDKVYQHCLREAQKIENSSDQVEQLVLELSIQLYWVSQLLDKDQGAVTPPVHLTSTGIEEPVAAVRPDGSMPIPFSSSVGGTNIAPLGFDLMWWILGGILLIAVVITLWCVSWVWRRDSLNRKPVLFEELTIPGRLGGEYSGGGFIGMSFDVSGRE